MLIIYAMRNVPKMKKPIATVVAATSILCFSSATGYVGGVPDTDWDGLNDLIDRCIYHPGPPDLQGCPDSDGDSYPDIDDDCPHTPGPVQGCPIASISVKIGHDSAFVDQSPSTDAGGARLSDILDVGGDEQGLGTPRNPIAAVAFLGVAAKPPTHPEITVRFNRIWDRVPEDMKPKLEQLIDEYNAKYGTKANRVSCDLSHRAGTHIKKLTCRFTDECSIYVKTIAGIAPTPELESCPRTSWVRDQ